MTYDQIPTSLNGLPVIHAELHRNCATVLVEDTDDRDGKFIVATYWPSLKNSWSWGHYFHGPDALPAAQSDFDDTAKRNATR